MTILPSKDDRYLPRAITNRRPTPPEAFLRRRAFLKAAAVAAVAPLGCGQESRDGAARTAVGAGTDVMLTPPLSWPASVTCRPSDAYPLPSSIASTVTPRAAAASKNNFYEFLFGRAGTVWRHTGDFTVEPWTVQITGACAKPQTLDLDALFKIPHEERLYHFRCVERWAMNVPWCGFPLATLLARAEPTADAKFVRFVSAMRPEQMPGLQSAGAANYDWPYHEALRMDEAMNGLAFVATGVYGEPLLKQHGAPLRIAVPWKYGYKNPKSIVRIELVREQPATFWAAAAPSEYGFLSNVNPNIPHPRWSQATSWWVDTEEKFPTPIFNGYDDVVGSLYPDEPRTLQAPLRPGEVAR